MSVHDSSPIDITSGLCSPRTIVISSDSSPAQDSDAFLYPPPEVSRQKSISTDQSIFLGSLGSRLTSPATGSRSRNPGMLPVRVSHPSNVSRSMLSRSVAPTNHYSAKLDVQLTVLREQLETSQTENGELCDRLEILQTENSELRGEIKAVTYIFIWSFHKYY